MFSGSKISDRLSMGASGPRTSSTLPVFTPMPVVPHM